MASTKLSRLPADILCGLDRQRALGRGRAAEWDFSSDDESEDGNREDDVVGEGGGMSREAGEGGVLLDTSDVHEKKVFVDDFGESTRDSSIGVTVRCSVSGLASISGFATTMEGVTIGLLGGTSGVGVGGCTST